MSTALRCTVSQFRISFKKTAILRRSAAGSEPIGVQIWFSHDHVNGHEPIRVAIAQVLLETTTYAQITILPAHGKT